MDLVQSILSIIGLVFGVIATFFRQTYSPALDFMQVAFIISSSPQFELLNFEFMFYMFSIDSDKKSYGLVSIGFIWILGGLLMVPAIMTKNSFFGE